MQTDQVNIVRQILERGAMDQAADVLTTMLAVRYKNNLIDFIREEQSDFDEAGVGVAGYSTEENAAESFNNMVYADATRQKVVDWLCKMLESDSAAESLADVIAGHSFVSQEDRSHAKELFPDVWANVEDLLRIEQAELLTPLDVDAPPEKPRTRYKFF